MFFAPFAAKFCLDSQMLAFLGLGKPNFMLFMRFGTKFLVLCFGAKLWPFWALGAIFFFFVCHILLFFYCVLFVFLSNQILPWNLGFSEPWKAKSKPFGINFCVFLTVAAKFWRRAPFGGQWFVFFGTKF